MPTEHQPLETSEAESHVSYASVFWTFFRIGLLTLGGGLAMATVMRHELVLKRRWIKDDDFMAEMSTATIVPGAIAVNVAYLQGRRLRGKRGAAAAILGTIIPSFCVILLIVWVAVPYFSNPRVAAFLRGCAIAVCGQLTFAGFIFGRRLLRSWLNVVVCVVGVIVVGVFGVHPIWGVVVAAVLGYWLCPIKNPPSQPDGPS